MTKNTLSESWKRTAEEIGATPRFENEEARKKWFDELQNAQIEDIKQRMVTWVEMTLDSTTKPEYTEKMLYLGNQIELGFRKKGPKTPNPEDFADENYEWPEK